MLKGFVKLATDAASSAKKSAMDAAIATIDKVKDGDAIDKVADKIKSINQSVINDWVKGKDAPDERTFYEKLSSSTKKVGEEVAVMGIKLWLAVSDKNTSIQHKAIIGAALAYFVLPVDMIPDVVAGVGFTDDAAAMALAVNSVGASITEEHESQAREKWKNF